MTLDEFEDKRKIRVLQLAFEECYKAIGLIPKENIAGKNFSGPIIYDDNYNPDEAIKLGYLSQLVISKTGISSWLLMGSGHSGKPSCKKFPTLRAYIEYATDAYIDYSDPAIKLRRRYFFGIKVGLEYFKNKKNKSLKSKRNEYLNSERFSSLQEEYVNG